MTQPDGPDGVAAAGLAMATGDGVAAAGLAMTPPVGFGRFAGGTTLPSLKSTPPIANFLAVMLRNSSKSPTGFGSTTGTSDIGAGDGAPSVGTGCGSSFGAGPHPRKTATTPGNVATSGLAISPATKRAM